MNFNLVLTTVIFCVVAQDVYAGRLPSDTKILMDTCYDVLPNCKNDYFAARSKDLKRWCCIRIVDENEDVYDSVMMNSNMVLTTLPTTTKTTTKKHKKYKSKNTDGTKEKKKKKHKKSHKSKSKTSMATVTSGPRWTTILTEITKNNRTETTIHLSTVKDNPLISTPSYFSLPKHTHITEHAKTVTLSNMQTGSSGVVSPTILNIPVTTISDSKFAQTTNSSTLLPPSIQLSSSTVSTINRDINTTTSNLSIMSTSRSITSKSEKSNSVSKGNKYDYEKTSLIPDTAISKASTLASSSLATLSKQLIPSTTSSNVADQDIKISSTNRPIATTSKLSPITEEVKPEKATAKPNNEGTSTISVISNKPITQSTYSPSSKLSSSLSTIGTTSKVSTKTTPTPFLKPYNSDRFKASNIRAGDSAEEEADEEPTTLTTQKTAKSSTISSSYSVPLISTEIPSDSNIKDKSGKAASERHLESSEKIKPVSESTRREVENFSSTIEKDLETTESEKRLNSKASSSSVADKDIEVTPSNRPLESKSKLLHTTEEVSSPKEGSEPTLESTHSIDTSSKTSPSFSRVHRTTSNVITKTTTKPFIKPHHWDNLKASNIRAGDSSEEESGEEPTTLTTQKTTKSSTFSSSYSVPLILPKIPSDSNIKDKSGKAALERHLGSSEKIETVTESPSSTYSIPGKLISSSTLSSTTMKDLEATESEKLLNSKVSSLTDADQDIVVTYTVDATTSNNPKATTIKSFMKPHHWIKDTTGKSAVERHLSSSEKIEQEAEFPSSTSTTPKKVKSSSSLSSSIKKDIEDTESEKPLNPKASSNDQDLELIDSPPKISTSSKQSEKIASANKAPSSTSFTSIKPGSLSTLAAVEEDSVTEDVFAKIPQNNLEVDTTLLNIPATPKAIRSSSEPVNSTIVNSIKSSLLSTETPFPTASLAPKLLNSGKLTTTSKKLNHAARFEDDDNDSGLVIQQQVQENDAGSNEEEEEVKLETTEETVEETEEETEEEPEKVLVKKRRPLIKVKGKSKIKNRRKASGKPVNLAVRV